MELSASLTLPPVSGGSPRGFRGLNCVSMNDFRFVPNIKWRPVHLVFDRFQMFSRKLRPEVREPHPSRQGPRFTPKQTIALSVLRNSTYGLLGVLRKSKIYSCTPRRHIYGGEGKTPIILSLASRRSVQNHAPTALSPRKPMVHSKHEAGWAAEPD